MHRLTLMVVLVCVTIIGWSVHGWGQEDQTEYKKGTIKYPDEPTENVQYKARILDGQTQLVGLVYFEELLKFEDIKVQEDGFTFIFTDENARLPCMIKKQNDRSYHGRCSYPESQKMIEMKVYSPKPTEGDPLKSGVGLAKGTGEGEG